MAKVRLVKWTVDGSILKAHRIIGESTVIEAEFDLTKLFTEFESFSDVQKQLIIYGTKQKLMDSGASEIGNAGGKIANAKKIWERMLDGHFDGERVNSTGASEERKIGKAIKQASEVISLEGLLLKKAMAQATGKTFSAEDEAKLQEFIRIASKAK